MSKISFSLESDEFRELMLLVIIGNYVRNGSLEGAGLYKPEKHEAMERAMLRAAGECEAPFVRSHEGHFDPSADLEAESIQYIEHFIDDTFWEELEIRLGRRDFDRTMTEEESDHIEETNGRLPKRVYELYKIYRDELDKYGVDRLEINKNAPVISDLM